MFIFYDIFVGKSVSLKLYNFKMLDSTDLLDTRIRIVLNVANSVYKTSKIINHYILNISKLTLDPLS